MDNIQAMLDSGNSDLMTEEERSLFSLPKSNQSASGFGDNIALTLDDSVLNDISDQVYRGYIADYESQADRRKDEKIGMRLLGISDEIDGELAFDGASDAVFPSLLEAGIQFQARAIAELWPAQGPAKALAEGDGIDPAKEQQAQRVASYLNWLYTTKMPGAYQHMDRMLFRLFFAGSEFKKIYFDSSAQSIVSRFVPSEEVLVPYGCDDLQTTPRITHIIRYVGSDIHKLIHDGIYRDVSIATLSEDTERSDLDAEKDATSGLEPTYSDIDESRHYVFLEQSVILSIDGDPEYSPYLVTIDRDSRTVFSIYRDWRESDIDRKRYQRFCHYMLLPGLDGFYGLGMFRALGRFARSLSGNLRALLDAGGLANLRGGFRSADVKLPKGNRGDGIGIRPGQWLPVEATTEELQKLFVSIPYQEPSQTLFNLIQWMDGIFRRVAGITEELVGESTKNVPVGTTLARIEQGLKVQTAIQMRCHQSMATELDMVCRLVKDTLPDPNYCRDVLHVSQEQFAMDFDSRIDIRPVSDPNAITSTQRLVIAQALYDMATAQPDLFDRREAATRLLEAMRIQNIEQIIVSPQQVPHMGPIEENMALTMGHPVKSFADQDHQAHIMVHQTWMNELEMDTKKRVEGAAIAHIAEHQAWAYYFSMQSAMGVQLPASPMGQPMPMTPEQENMLSMLSAQAAQLMASQPPQQAGPEPSKAMLDTAKTAAVEADIRRKDAIAQAQIARDDATTIARMNRDQAEREAQLAAQFVSRNAQDVLGSTPI